MKDRRKLNLFYSGEENATPYLKAQEITDNVYFANKLCIVSLAMDFPVGHSSKHSIEKIKDYLIEFNSIIEKMEPNQTKIRTLTQTRDTLLPKLMSGGVRVNL